MSPEYAILFKLSQIKFIHLCSSRLDAISESNAVKPSTPTFDPRDNYKIDDMESGYF